MREMEARYRPTILSDLQNITKPWGGIYAYPEPLLIRVTSETTTYQTFRTMIIYEFMSYVLIYAELRVTSETILSITKIWAELSFIPSHYWLG